VNGGEGGAHQQGGHQQKAHCYHQAKRNQPLNHQHPKKAAVSLGFYSPDGIQRCLELQKGAGGPQKKRDDAGCGRGHTGGGSGGAFQHGLHCLRPFPPKQALNLAYDLPSHRLLAKDQASHRDGHH
jgi:hypothetical protein